MAKIFDHESPEYAESWNKLGGDKYNGAYYYAKEIKENIMPLVKTSRNWVLVNKPGHCWDHSIVFIHNNKHPEIYNWLKDYDDLVLVTGVPGTGEKLEHLGYKTIYLPLTIDTIYVQHFYKARKTKDRAIVGRYSKIKDNIPPHTDVLANMPREELLKRMADYKFVYAVGRCALEAKALGCHVLPYDKRFPDPALWEVIDNKVAGYFLNFALKGLK